MDDYKTNLKHNFEVGIGAISGIPRFSKVAGMEVDSEPYAILVSFLLTEYRNLFFPNETEEFVKQHVIDQCIKEHGQIDISNVSR